MSEHPLMTPGGMSDLVIPERDPMPADCGCSSPRECYCYDNGHTGNPCLSCGREIDEE